VACADLKPISQKELSEFSRAERQTNIAFKKTTSAKRPASERRFQTAPALDVPPATAVDFCRNWNRHLKTVEAKFRSTLFQARQPVRQRLTNVSLLVYRYLQVTTPARLADMFKPDLDSDLLAEIAQVLAASWRQKAADVSPEEPPQAAFALSTLEALARTARFSLILDFLDGCQTDKLRELFDLVEASDELQQEDLARLSSVKHKFRLG
jgi:hypothetical protein